MATTEERVEGRLTAILAADVAGYSRLIGADGEAAPKLLLAIQDNPGFPSAYRASPRAVPNMGRPEEARATVAKLRTISPLVAPNDLPWRNRDDRELYRSGLRLAAGETN